RCIGSRARSLALLCAAGTVRSRRGPDTTDLYVCRAAVPVGDLCASVRSRGSAHAQGTGGTGGPGGILRRGAECGAGAEPVGTLVDTAAAGYALATAARR